jgi:tetratricopeptide (TPR) repeat protein
MVSGLLLALLAGGFGSRTLLRNELWQDEVGIWREAVIVSPASVRSRYNLGVALIRAGKLQRAQSAFERAIELGPSDDMSYAALGYCAEMRGDLAGAIGFYRRSLGFNAENTYASARLKELQEGLSPRPRAMEGT